MGTDAPGQNRTVTDLDGGGDRRLFYDACPRFDFAYYLYSTCLCKWVKESIEMNSINWKTKTGIRDRLIHDFIGVNYLIVWDVIKNKILDLDKQILIELGRNSNWKFQNIPQILINQTFNPKLHAPSSRNHQTFRRSAGNCLFSIFHQGIHGRMVGTEGFWHRDQEIWIPAQWDIHYVLLGPGGFEMWGKFTFLENEAPNRITFLNCFSNAAGETVKAPEIPFGPDWPLEMWTEYRFTEQGDHKPSSNLPPTLTMPAKQATNFS